MPREMINIKYIQQAIREVVIPNWFKRTTHLLSLPYRTVFENNVNLTVVGGDVYSVKNVGYVEFPIGNVSLYGFDTVYNPDKPIGLIAKK